MREIGSYFEYPSEEDFGASPVEHDFLKDSQLFASGRAVFAFLGKKLGRRTMFIPDYFCPHTANFISNYFDIVRYKDVPDAPPMLENIENNCVLLAVNTFGMYRPERYHLRETGKRVILIEDHSHAPFSRYARESHADYSMASLRKTLPLGNAAYLRAKDALSGGSTIGGNASEERLFFEAAHRKRAYLSAGDGDKSAFLRLYDEFETAVENNTSIARIGAESRRLLFSLNIRKLQNIRAENFFLFKDLIRVPLVNGNISEADSVFNPVIMLRNKETRDALRGQLIAAKVYPPIHWILPNEQDISTESRQLSERVLTIPLDHRYGESDVERVAKIVNGFSCGC